MKDTTVKVHRADLEPEIARQLDESRKESKRSRSGEVNWICQEYFKNFNGDGNGGQSDNARKY